MSKKLSFEEILNEVSSKYQQPASRREDAEALSAEDFPVVDETDLLVILHRDAHFGGSFPVMLEYYEMEGKGVSDEIEMERILRLQELEKELKYDLIALVEGTPDAQRIEASKQAYAALRELYEQEEVNTSNAQLIADLVFSEEEEPEEEIQAILNEGESIVDDLIRLVQSQEFLDPLFPGYGQAPLLAAHCLGELKDPRAIAPLFEALRPDQHELEEAALRALGHIGDEAKQFYLKVLQSTPVTHDHEKASVGLGYFGDDPEVGDVCYQVLEDHIDTLPPRLLPYLFLNCEGLQDPAKRQRLKALGMHPNVSEETREDIDMMVRQWERKQ